MKWIFILYLIFLKINLFGQNNLVRNYSFENNIFVLPCQNSPTPHIELFNPSNSVSQSDLSAYWNSIEAWDVPSIRGLCVGTASPDCLCDNGFAHSGIFYGRHVNREYIVQELSQVIPQGHYFYYEFYIKGFNGGIFEDVGIKLFSEKPSQCKYNKLHPNSNSQPQIKVNNILKDGNWKKVSGTFLADQNYSWISLGTYGGDYGDDAFWDDLKIINLGATRCPAYWFFENTIFENENNIFQAGDKIIAGENVDPNNINGPVIVKSNSNIIFKAGNQVILEPGFSTENGAYFETVIEPCSNNPCPYPPLALGDVEICDANSVPIGNQAPETGLFYTWSPATYLDNPNSPNPVFTPPNGSGEIQYTVTITSICGYFSNNSVPPSVQFSIIQNVTVAYHTNPNPNPSISISNVQTADYDFSFDFTVGNETEEYCVQIVEQGTGNIAYSNCFDVLTGSCCNLSFNYDMLSDLEKDNFSICKDYTIIVSAKNYCYPNYASEQFDWNRDDSFSLTFVPNVISIANPLEGYYTNGVNDEFCIEGTGIDSWDLGVFNPAFPAQYFYKYDGHFDQSPQCIWDGRAGTNQGVNLSTTPGNSASAGFAYAYILDVTGCNTSQTSTGIINVFWDIPPQMALYVASTDGNELSNSESSNTQLELGDNDLSKEKMEIFIYPNPSQGVFNITYSTIVESKNFIINIYDNIGQLILSDNKIINSIDLSKYSNGIYFLEIKTDSGIFREKIIKN